MGQLLVVHQCQTALLMVDCSLHLSSSRYSVFIRCCPLSRDGRIHPIPSAIACTPSLHFVRFRTSFFQPVFSVSSSTCFLQVLFSRPRFLLPFTSRSRATLIALWKYNPQNSHSYFIWTVSILIVIFLLA